MPYWWTRYVVGYYASEMCFLPLLVAWLRTVKPDLVVYCPQEFVCGHWAAQHLGIRSVSLSVVAGPGAVEEGKGRGLAQLGVTWEKAAQACADSPWNRRAMEELEGHYGIKLTRTPWEKPVEFDNYAKENIVTATAEFALRGEAFEAFKLARKRFVFVGALLDLPGAKRCSWDCNGRLDGGELHMEAQPQLHRLRSDVGKELPLRIAVRAKQATRRIIYVSMGPSLTCRWWHRRLSCGRSHSPVMGRDLCKAVYQAVFDAVGDFEAVDEVDSVVAAWAHPDSPPLIVVDVGPQSDALAGLRVPGNALCRTAVPQAELLGLQPALFVTHGGQHALIEGMQAGVPLVICSPMKDPPLITDMVVTSGVGVKVPSLGSAGGGALAAYLAGVRGAVLEALGKPRYAACALEVSQKMKKTGGVEAAVRLICG
mmetsp:Transcript_24424/g.75971  ORF Transcript_24424/g.75971 Transcript_24424/m.75971 type:complete len:426 (+) Transcript_24424:350-1627(+)